MASFLSVYKIIEWTAVKARIETSASLPAPARKREIWWASIGQNIGVEANGKHGAFERPVLILKVFNIDSVLAVILTTTSKENRYIMNIAGLDHSNSAVNLSQIRTISSKRLLRLQSMMTDPEFQTILNEIFKMIKEETPIDGALPGSLDENLI